MTTGGGGEAPGMRPGTRVRLLDSPYNRSMNAVFGEATVLEQEDDEGTLTVEMELAPWLSGLPLHYLYPKIAEVEVIAAADGAARRPIREPLTCPRCANGRAFTAEVRTENGFEFVNLDGSGADSPNHGSTPFPQGRLGHGDFGGVAHGVVCLRCGENLGKVRFSPQTDPASGTRESKKKKNKRQRGRRKPRRNLLF